VTPWLQLTLEKHLLTRNNFSLQLSRLLMAENQQLALRENSDGEEVSQPEGRRYVLTLQPVLINTTPWIRGETLDQIWRII
jgi:hypothetical protein